MKVAVRATLFVMVISVVAGIIAFSFTYAIQSMDRDATACRDGFVYLRGVCIEGYRP